MAKQRQPRRVDAYSELRIRATSERLRHAADRRGFRLAENDDFKRQTFTLPLETARRRVREILDRIPHLGRLEIVEGWRQLPDGNIEFTTRQLLTSE